MTTTSSSSNGPLLPGWQQFSLPVLNLSETEVLRAMVNAGVQVHLKEVTNDSINFEIYGETHQELISAEFQVRQRLIDQQLRKEIEQKSSNKITNIVEAVISRASGS